MSIYQLAYSQKFVEIEYVFPGQTKPSTISVEEYHDYYLFHGDMMIPKSKDIQKGVAFGVATFWDCGIIPYQINSTGFSASDLNLINQAINEVNSKTNLNLVSRTSETDYIIIQHDLMSCSSFFGKIGGPQEIKLSPGNCFLQWGTVAHEIFHAAGLMHEQCHPERDNFITINWNNISGECEYCPPNPSSCNPIIFDSREACHEYDLESVMHYSALQGAVGGPTFTVNPGVPLAPGFVVGQRSFISDGDASAINSLYPLCGNELNKSIELGGSGTDEVAGIIVDSGGNKYIIGQTYSNNGDFTNVHSNTSIGGGEAYVMKIGSNDNIIWTYAVGGNGIEEFRAIHLADDGFLYVGGTTTSNNNGGIPSSNGGYDALIVKLNPNTGSAIWIETYGSNFTEKVVGIHDSTIPGEIFIVAQTNSPGNNSNYDIPNSGTGITFNRTWVYTVNETTAQIGAINKIHFYNVNGDTNSFNTNASDRSQYGYIITGSSDENSSNGCAPTSTSVDNMLFLYLNNNGDMIWSKLYGGSQGVQAGIGVHSNNDGSFIAVGYSTNASNDCDVQTTRYGNRDMYVVKVDQNGNFLWGKLFGESINEVAHDVIELSNGDFMISGYSTSDICAEDNAGFEDVYIMQLTPNGEVVRFDSQLGGSRSDAYAFSYNTFQPGVYLTTDIYENVWFVSSASSNDGDLPGTVNSNLGVDIWIGGIGEFNDTYSNCGPVFPMNFSNSQLINTPFSVPNLPRQVPPCLYQICFDVIVFGDIENPFERPYIIAEDGITVLGQVKNAINQCNFSITTICLSPSQYNNWAADGTVDFILQADGDVNSICPNNLVYACAKLVQCGPDNNFCDGAVDLTVNNTCSAATYTNVGYSESATLPNFSCHSSTYKDVWFRATVPNSGNMKILTSQVNGGLTDLVVQVLSGSCGNLIEVACNDDGGPNFHSFVSLSGRTPGELLYIRVVDWGSNNFGNFGICVYDDTSGCPPNYSGGNQLTGIQTNIADFETDGVIQSTQTIRANVDYDSGQYIDLLPGFEVELGKYFNAFIDGCGGSAIETETGNSSK